MHAQPDHRQRTTIAPAICAGVGVHSGRRVRMSIRPAASGHGIVFVRTDVTDRDNRIPVSGEAVVRTQLNTEIGNAAGVTVSTIEHLMAALSALGVSNALIEVDGPEVPIMDGSALPFVQLLDRAGFRPQETPRSFIEVLEPIMVEQPGKMAALLPCDRFEVFFELEYATPLIGRQSVDLVVTEDSFREELAAARTFGFVEEVEALRAMGLARGGSLENAVVIDGDRVLNPDGLRMEREFVRHKAMDAVGDLYVLGRPLLARFETRRGGHALNNLLVRELLARPNAWREVTRAPQLGLTA
ncbi:UDP-3-O-acyl-N-acetylglucosamine deacetylase [Brevundimonas sp. 2R-24]|uniref:UDP-3-O-acyl-N-acetylglucosamine deacetylase n=1 Tax=Peiella sedimenti TaxID=3061083 RepID=A0ABT8SNR5_9CAUL|nr:UDP-3-O-acyl-N-acetylglucosamine deacetylase [Caulobacteraceae bacterium XZ-24]